MVMHQAASACCGDRLSNGTGNGSAGIWFRRLRVCAQHPDQTVRCVSVESKREFVDEMAHIKGKSDALTELHFVGHSGMYGPMFRTTALPEQFSPFEWRELATSRALPFAPNGQAYFHACRTARWFAQFFAQTFGVPAHGYHWYTTISVRPDTFH